MPRRVPISYGQQPLLDSSRLLVTLPQVALSTVVDVLTQAKLQLVFLNNHIKSPVSDVHRFWFETARAPETNINNYSVLAHMCSSKDQKVSVPHHYFRQAGRLIITLLSG